MSAAAETMNSQYGANGPRISFVHWRILGIVAWIFVYVAALIWRRDAVPNGLINDAAEEALRGLYLLEDPKFEVMTFALGNSAETLYLYIVGAAAKWLGATTLAVQLPSWAVAVASIWLLCVVTHRMDASIPVWVPLMLGTSSVWLFHYARSGLRAIAAPLFFLIFWQLLDRAERPAEKRWVALGCGAVLGLSLYAYTSCRALPLVFLLYVLVRMARRSADRPALMRRYGLIVVGAIVVSIPNILFFLRFPNEFLSRGTYVLSGGVSGMAANVLWTFLLPFSLYSDVYRNTAGPAYYFDGASAGLTVAPINPIHPIVAAAFLAGIVKAWRARREPAMLFFIVAWLSVTAVLGIAGPGLTRMLIVLPAYLFLAAVGVGEGVKRLPRFRLLFVGALLAVMAAHGYAYFVRFARSPVSSFLFAPAATPIGKRAAALASEGRRVVCVVFKDANVVRYLTHSYPASVRVSEFYFRPLVVEEIPLAEFDPEVLLIEKFDGFAAFNKLFPSEWHRNTQDRFDEIHLQRQGR